MSWRCSGQTNAQLIANLVNANLLTTVRVISAFNQTDRADFLSPLSGGSPYQDAPLYLDFGATISAPHMHAVCTEALAPSLVEGARVLDVGSGSGYLCAIFARLVGPSGYVEGVEHVLELVTRANGVLDRTLPPALRATINNHVGDGRVAATIGGGGGFDAIHVGAAALRNHIPIFVKNLRPGGRLVVPVNTPLGDQDLIIVERPLDGSLPFEKAICGVRYVPLTDLGAQVGGGIV